MKYFAVSVGLNVETFGMVHVRGSIHGHDFGD